MLVFLSIVPQGAATTMGIAQLFLAHPYPPTATTGTTGTIGGFIMLWLPWRLYLLLHRPLAVLCIVGGGPDK